MIRVSITISLEDGTDTFKWELDRLPQKGDLIRFQKGDVIYEVDTILHNAYDVDCDYKAELVVHPFKA